ncbi:MAG: DNA repair and recombination protein RadA [Candidatus Woesearchaeota archaeon]|jgi:DNA repair protein RadA
MSTDVLDLSTLSGVGPATIEKLSSCGFANVMAVAVATPGEIATATGISEQAARKMISQARDAMDMGFEDGSQCLVKRQDVFKIKTGSTEFDKILGGGFESSAITECFGQYASSKTQLAHQLCVNLIKNDPDAYAIYVDTENTFRPERIVEMAHGADMEPQDVLSHIKIAKAYNSDHQMILAEKVNDLIDDGLKVKLVIIDSLTSHFRAEYVGRGTLADRQQKLNKHMHVLSRLANTHNLCVYVTNQVMARPDCFFGDPTESIGGNIVGHNSTFRIYLRRGKKGTRVAKLIDAPNMPDAEAIYEVHSEGLVDTKEGK